MTHDHDSQSWESAANPQRDFDPAPHEPQDALEIDLADRQTATQSLAHAFDDIIARARDLARDRRPMDVVDGGQLIGAEAAEEIGRAHV